MNTLAPTVVSATDRLGFTLFFATALHAITILGITFTLQDEKALETTIEVTLAQRPQDVQPEEADFIAQANQLASGNSSEKRAPSTTEKAEFQDNKIKPLAQRQPPAPQTAKQETPNKPTIKNTQTTDNSVNPLSNTNKKVVTTTQPSTKKAPIKREETKDAQPDSTPGASTSLLARSLEIASLQAQIERNREELAKKPRVRRLTSASTRQQDDALYLDNWRKKIENVGNLNYPEEARRNKMYGSLRLLVAIKPDGSVSNIEILETSGFPVLDDAAIRIVRLAAPFQPFPVEIRKNTDIMEIIRTWKFEKKAYIY